MEENELEEEDVVVVWKLRNKDGKEWTEWTRDIQPSHWLLQDSNNHPILEIGTQGRLSLELILTVNLLTG